VPGVVALSDAFADVDGAVAGVVVEDGAGAVLGEIGGLDFMVTAMTP
jgi:hypothetical protein